MCGRYALAMNGEAIAAALQATPILPEIVAWTERYNIAPTQLAPVAIANHDATRRLALMRWGLVPFWAKDPSIGARMVNARAESLAEKPAFRDAWQRRRCLVPATAFYEWETPGDPTQRTKRPYAIAPTKAASGTPLFALGGVWDRWRSPDKGDVLSFSIVTVSANELVGRVHDRMPVILPRDAWSRWLADGTAPGDLLVPASNDVMRLWPVSLLVNSPRNDGPDCLAPV
jgi:putative SOS response-associated peptidase YedK